MVKVNNIAHEMTQKNYFNDDEPVSVSVGELLQLRSDHLAWAAPCCMEINQDEEVPSGLQFGIKVGLRERYKVESSWSFVQKRTRVTSSLA